MQILRRLRRNVRGLNPYLALFVLLLPFAIIEPLKLAAVIVFGKGHWIAGLIVMFTAYAASIFFLEWLFKIVKPKLLDLPWFERTYKKYAAIRRKLSDWLRATWPVGTAKRRNSVLTKSHR